MSFIFNDTPTTDIYTLSLHDALPIYARLPVHLRVLRHHRHVRAENALQAGRASAERGPGLGRPGQDRKSTRLNSSHMSISYAVFCLKKKNATVEGGGQRLFRYDTRRD